MFDRFRRRGRTSVTVSHSTGINVASDSDRATQKSRQSFVRDDHGDHHQEFITFAKDLRQSLSPQNSDADQLATDIESAAQANDQGALRVALSSAQTAVAGALGTDIGENLWKSLKPLLRAVGLGT